MQHSMKHNGIPYMQPGHADMVHDAKFVKSSQEEKGVTFNVKEFNYVM